MFKLTSLFLFLLLQSCSNQPSKPENPDTRYFSDATDCFQTSDRKLKIPIPFSTREGVMLSSMDLEIPLAGDAGAFRQCMEYKGHPHMVGKINVNDYLSVSRACMDKARDSSTPNETYASCVQHGQITVEPIAPGRQK